MLAPGSMQRNSTARCSSRTCTWRSPDSSCRMDRGVWEEIRQTTFGSGELAAPQRVHAYATHMRQTRWRGSRFSIYIRAPTPAPTPLPHCSIHPDSAPTPAPTPLPPAAYHGRRISPAAVRLGRQRAAVAPQAQHRARLQRRRCVPLWARRRGSVHAVRLRSPSSFAPASLSLVVAVMTAEIVHHYFPKAVELHNYSAANGVRQKLYNWATLNRSCAVSGGAPRARGRWRWRRRRRPLPWRQPRGRSPPAGAQASAPPSLSHRSKRAAASASRRTRVQAVRLRGEARGRRGDRCVQARGRRGRAHAAATEGACTHGGTRQQPARGCRAVRGHNSCPAPAPTPPP